MQMFECQMVGCSTLVDRQQRTHGHRWLNGELKARRDQQNRRLRSVSSDDTERRRRRAVLATGTASSVKYRGVAPVRQRCMSTHGLNFTRSGTRSQWRSISNGVTWSYLRASADRRAAALTTDYAHGPIIQKYRNRTQRKETQWSVFSEHTGLLEYTERPQKDVNMLVMAKLVYRTTKLMFSVCWNVFVALSYARMQLSYSWHVCLSVCLSVRPSVCHMLVLTQHWWQ